MTVARPALPNLLNGRLPFFYGWVIVAVVRSFTDNWRKVREAEQAAALKQSMVEKGMSADDRRCRTDELKLLNERAA